MSTSDASSDRAETHPLLTVIFLLALGCYVIYFGRWAYRSPREYAKRWDHWTSFTPLTALPPRLLAMLGAFGTFLGCLIITEAVALFASIPRNVRTAEICCAIAFVASIALLIDWRSYRSSSEAKSRGQVISAGRPLDEDPEQLHRAFRSRRRKS